MWEEIVSRQKIWNSLLYKLRETFRLHRRNRPQFARHFSAIQNGSGRSECYTCLSAFVIL